MFDLLFELAGMIVMLAWIALAASPWLGRAKPIVRMVTGAVVPGVLALAYVALVAMSWPAAGGGYGSLDDVSTLFGHRGMLTAGWYHYLAFDLFVGTWLARRAERDGIAPLWMIPCHALTFLFGPAGLVAYGLLYAAKPVRALVRELERRHGPLARFGLILVAALAASLAMAAIDARTLGGVGVWVKPMKFMASVALYAWTTAWLIGELPSGFRASPAVRRLARTIILVGAAEVAYITLQAALGQPSHFNDSTPFHSAMYVLMGVGALTLTACSLPLAWMIGRHAEDMAPAYRLGAVLGLVLTFVFGAGAGVAISMNGGPTIGAMAGGAVVPVFGWSLAGGDLRVAHFLGIHAQQVLPAAGMLASMAAARASGPVLAVAGTGMVARHATTGIAAVWLVALAYASLTVLAAAQAVAGRPLLG